MFMWKNCERTEKMAEGRRGLHGNWLGYEMMILSLFVESDMLPLPKTDIFLHHQLECEFTLADVSCSINIAGLFTLSGHWTDFQLLTAALAHKSLSADCQKKSLSHDWYKVSMDWHSYSEQMLNREYYYLGMQLPIITCGCLAHLGCAPTKRSLGVGHRMQSCTSFLYSNRIHPSRSHLRNRCGRQEPLVRIQKQNCEQRWFGATIDLTSVSAVPRGHPMISPECTVNTMESNSWRRSMLYIPRMA
jgi:hypothetical protein